MTVFNAASMYGMYPNIYNNQIAMNDLSGMDLYAPMGMMMDPMLSMNGSIFPGMNMGMGCMPYMPYGGGMNYENYYKQYEKYQDFMIDSQVRQQQKWRNADLQLNSPQEGIAKQAKILHEKIMLDEQEQIMQAYQSFKESVRGLYPQATEEQVANRASTLYQQAIGKTITDDVREHGRDSLTQGFLQTLTFGLSDKKSAEENISDLTGQPVGRKEKAKKVVGNIAGGAVIGGATVAAASPLLKALKLSSKSRTFWGLLAGAVVGTVAAVTTSK